MEPRVLDRTVTYLIDDSLDQVKFPLKSRIQQQGQRAELDMLPTVYPGCSRLMQDRLFTLKDGDQTLITDVFSVET